MKYFIRVIEVFALYFLIGLLKYLVHLSNYWPSLIRYLYYLIWYWLKHYPRMLIETTAEDLIAILHIVRHYGDGSDTRLDLLEIRVCDYPERKKRFEISYVVHRRRDNLVLRFKLEVDSLTLLPSLVEHFPSAEWAEREIALKFGIFFGVNPDYDEYPLGKELEDHPLGGYTMVRYFISREQVYETTPVVKMLYTKLYKGK